MQSKDGIAVLTRADADAVAVLHRRVFPAYRSTQLGSRFCTRMYQTYADLPEAFGFVLRRGGHISGFAVGGGRNIGKQVDSALRTRAVCSAIVHPSLLCKELLAIVRKRLRRTPAKHPASSEVKVAKLTLIGVDEPSRGTGAACLLLSCFVAEAGRRGYSRVILTVDRNNGRARAAYEKAGWKASDGAGNSVQYWVAASVVDSSPGLLEF